MHRAYVKQRLRRFALLGGLCLVASSSSAVGVPEEYILNETQVGEMWANSFWEFQDCYSPDERIDAREMYACTGSGFSGIHPFIELQDLSLSYTTTSSNILLWADGYPVVEYDSRYGDISAPFNFPTIYDALTLYSSGFTVVDSLSLPAFADAGQIGSVFRGHTLSVFGVKRSGVLIRWKDCPVAVDWVVSVKHSPFWWAGASGFYCTASTYEEITGEALDAPPAPCIIKGIFTNFTFKVKERFR